MAHTCTNMMLRNLKEIEIRKADRMVGVNCKLYIFQYFVRHDLTSSENVLEILLTNSGLECLISFSGILAMKCLF